MGAASSGWLAPPGPVAPGLRIGLLGGSFNPAHAGHLHISEIARRRLGLDYVWWLVSPGNPLKPAAGMAPLAQRVAGAMLEARGASRILVLDIEHALHTRYTIDTLKALTRRFPQLRFVWLMGSDNLANFQCWRRWPDIVARVPVAVVLRPGNVLAPLSAKAMQRFARARRAQPGRPPSITILDGPRNPMSSTALRAGLMPREALVRAIPAC